MARRWCHGFPKLATKGTAEFLHANDLPCDHV
jgi:hypothetical protein